MQAAQSRRVRWSLTRTWSQPASGSLTRNTVTAPARPHSGSSRRARPAARAERGPHLRQQLRTGLVQTHDRMSGVVVLGELRVPFRRDAPLLPQPRLECVCSKVLRTVSWEIVSSTSSRTSSSARSRRLQRTWTSGGILQASAISRASCSPSSLRGTPAGDGDAPRPR